MNSTSTIKINLSAGIMSNSTTEAKRIGISLQDFIRMLLATYFAKSDSIQSISRDKIFLDKAKKEISAGKYKEFHSPKELSDYLLSI